MRGAETIGRSAERVCFATLLALAAASGCDEHRHPPRKPPSRSASPFGLDADAGLPPVNSAPAALATPIERALAEVHAEKAEIPPLRDEPARLAFGKNRLAQATQTKVVFRDSKDGSVVVDADLRGLFAVASSPNGSLFALGPAGGAWLEPQHAKVRSFAHVAFFRGAELYPDLQQPTAFYVYYGAEHELFHYSSEGAAGAFLPIEARFPLGACESAPSLTRDGAFLCSTADGISRRAPRGRETHFALPKSIKPVRLLGAKRFDEIYAVTQSGEVARLRLEPGMPERARFQLPAPPFAATTNGEVLAFVLVTPPAVGKPRQFTLLVTDLDGSERLKVDLPSPEAKADDDWLERVTEDKSLALSSFDSFVAVGGPNIVSVWDYRQGTLVFSR